MTDQESKTCGRCQAVKPLDTFAPSQHSKASAWCKECRTVYYRNRNGSAPREVIPVVVGRVRCGRCKEHKLAEEFAKSQCHTGGWCRECFRAWHRERSPLPEGYGTCEYCGEGITGAKDVRRRFCSENCKMRARYWRLNPRATRACDQCSLDITMMRKDARFCSEDCAITWRNRNKTPGQRRAEKLWTNYKITPADYDGMLLAQGGACAICGGTDPRSHHGFWHVDHCHDSGAVRGLLCGPCNTGIGQLGDDPEVLDRAAAYLRRARSAR